MTTADNHDSRRTRNALVLERLRAAFGEEREGEFADLDGFGMLATFLRPLPRDDEASETELSRSDLAALRRHRREHRQSPAPDVQSLPAMSESTARSTGYAALIEELPELRAHFAEWLAGVDTDFVPSASSLEELQALRSRVEYRLRLLNTLVAETQHELDSLIVAIRATEATRQDR